MTFDKCKPQLLVKESCTQVCQLCLSSSKHLCALRHASCLLPFIMLKHTSLLRVVNESEKVLVDKLRRRFIRQWCWCQDDFCDPSADSDLPCNTGKPRNMQPFPCIYKYFYNSSPMICALSKIGIGCIPNYCMTFLDIPILFLVTLQQ